MLHDYAFVRTQAPEIGACGRPTRPSPGVSLADMVRKGLLTPPVAPGVGPPPAPKPIMKLEELLAELDQDRSDR